MAHQGVAIDMIYHLGNSPVFHYKIVVHHGVSESTNSLTVDWNEILDKQFSS